MKNVILVQTFTSVHSIEKMFEILKNKKILETIFAKKNPALLAKKNWREKNCQNPFQNNKYHKTKKRRRKKVALTTKPVLGRVKPP